MNIDQLREELAHDEGRQLSIYICSAEKRTVGIGHMILDGDPESAMAIGDEISDDRCDELFAQDIAGTIKDCDWLFKSWHDQPDDVRLILANMMFNLGMPRLSNFKKMRAAIDASPPDYLEAAVQMADSRWARQLPNRSARLINRMENVA